MEVFVDDQPHPIDVSASQTVGHVLDQILQQARAAGRAVLSIRIDGAEVDGEELERVLADKTDAYTRLDFVTGMAADLAVDALSRVQAMLMSLQPVGEQAVEKLNQGQTAEAMELLGHYFDGWRQAHQAISQSAQLLNVDLAAISVDGAPVNELFQQAVEQLGQLKDALESKDHVTVADILSYEFGETTERWIKLVEAVKNTAQGQ